MAEIPHRYVEDNTASSTTTTTTVTVVSAGNLTAHTKYLLIARALIGSESASGKVVFNIETLDDTNIALKSKVTYEMMQLTDTGLKSYFFVHSYETDATPAAIAYTLTSDDGSSVVNLDNFSLIAIDLGAMASDDGYFDGTVTSTVEWSDDTNAGDGSETTYAFAGGAGSGGNDTKYVQVDGNTAPAPSVYGTVQARVLVQSDTGTRGVSLKVFDGGVDLGLAIATTATTTKAWSAWGDVAIPAGGWTDAKYQGLEGRAYLPILNGNEGRVFKMEVRNAPWVEDILAATGSEIAVQASWSVLAEITDTTLGGAANDHLVLGCAKIGIGSTGRYFAGELDGIATTYNEMTEEGEDTAEDRMLGFVGVRTNSSTVRIRVQEEASAGNMTDEGSYLIAIPLGAFADFEYDYTIGTQAITAEATIASVGPYTPSVSGNHLILGMTGSVVGTADGADLFLHLEDGTTETRTGDHFVTHDQVWDGAKDAESAYTMQRLSISTAKTYNLRANGAAWTAENRLLVVLNLSTAAVAASPGPFPRRQRTTVRM